MHILNIGIFSQISETTNWGCFTSVTVKLPDVQTKISLKEPQMVSNFLLKLLVVFCCYIVIKLSIISSKQYFCFQNNDAQCNIRADNTYVNVLKFLLIC